MTAKTYSTASTARRAAKNWAKKMGLDPELFEINSDENGHSVIVLSNDSQTRTAAVEAGFYVEEAEAIEWTEADLDEMGFNGAGTEEAPACPHCGVDHLDNGYGVHDPVDHPHDEREIRCLGCGGEWGPRIKRRKGGRVATFAGKRITVLIDHNPRREGVPGWHSFNIMMANPGITYEEFLEKGGRREDLKWDFDRNRVRLD